MVEAETMNLNGYTKVKFHSFHYVMFISGLILFLLPLYNFPLTSNEGQEYSLKFFLDPALISNLNVERNTIELLFPMPIYYIFGILPGLIGLILLFRSITTILPSSLLITNERIYLREPVLGLPTFIQLKTNEIEMVSIGARVIKQAHWWLFLFIGFWAFHVWSYGFDSVQSNGSWYYFSVTQEIWDFNVVIGEINLGEHVLMTFLAFIISPLLLVVFPRKKFNIITGKTVVEVKYSGLSIDNGIKDKNRSITTVSSIILASKMKSRNQFGTGTDKSWRLISRKEKILLISLFTLIIFALIHQLIPNFYFGSFTIPFSLITLATFSYFFTKSIYKYNFNQNDNSNSKYRCFYQRLAIMKPKIVLFNEPTDRNFKMKYRKPKTIEYILVGILIWESLILITNFIENIEYTWNNPQSIIQMIIVAIILIVIYIYYKQTLSVYSIENLIEIPVKMHKLREPNKFQYEIMLIIVIPVLFYSLWLYLHLTGISPFFEFLFL